MELREKLRKMKLLRLKNQETNRPKTYKTIYPDRKKLEQVKNGCHCVT
jgi:hypothetical protein